MHAGTISIPIPRSRKCIILPPNSVVVKIDRIVFRTWIVSGVRTL